MSAVIIVTKPVTYEPRDKVVATFDCKSVSLESVKQAFPKDDGYIVHSPVKLELDVYDYYIPKDDGEINPTILTMIDDMFGCIEG
jgi:hypothetical protein